MDRSPAWRHARVTAGRRSRRTRPLPSRPSSPSSTAATGRSSASSATVVEVSADILKEGHDLLQARVDLSAESADAEWQEAPMRLIENDRWAGQFSVDAEHALPVQRARVHRRLRLLARRLSETPGGGPGRVLRAARRRCDWSSRPSSAAPTPSDRGRLQAYAERWRIASAARPASARPPSWPFRPSSASSWTAGPIAATRRATAASCG